MIKVLRRLVSLLFCSSFFLLPPAVTSSHGCGCSTSLTTLTINAGSGGPGGHCCHGASGEMVVMVPSLLQVLQLLARGDKLQFVMG